MNFLGLIYLDIEYSLRDWGLRYVLVSRIRFLNGTSTVLRIRFEGEKGLLSL